MYCHKCNNKVKEGQEVCLNCGHILGFESIPCKKCIHCNREIPVNYTKCPFCKKKLDSKIRKKAYIFIIITILLNIVCLSKLYEPTNNRVKDNYIDICTSITYEQMIRRAEYYNNYDVTFSGKIISITTTNKINKKINLTIMMENSETNLVDIEFKNQEQLGFMINDEVMVYGKYKSLNGNIPYIKAQYIIIKET